MEMGWVQNKKQIGGLVHACFECFFIIVFFSWLRLFLSCVFHQTTFFFSMGLCVRLGLAHSLEAASSLTRSYFITAGFQQHHERKGDKG